LLRFIQSLIGHNKKFIGLKVIELGAHSEWQLQIVIFKRIKFANMNELYYF